ncbi:cytosolic phospholipase A2 zeta [Cordyceps fumosorosea ARSEF 2679]|uniref:Lysophospholipase n=1 Tax=Cordyceps fumosorosea (strain ARSEF 2679) TaxID=1081104 RepID=A0A168APF9_CORFA|nr:cytosolic phospholipase A2 zeta [Cordyceps fumosorosea ARSEF 2679]OAA69015.1 cytosolic phospholipase A2 zeta [Cordyceps fumosorosea ARSEF 2679]
MKHPGTILGQLASKGIRPTVVSRAGFSALQPRLGNGLFTAAKQRQRRRVSATTSVVAGGFLTWLLYPTDDFRRLSAGQQGQTKPVHTSAGSKPDDSVPTTETPQGDAEAGEPVEETAWSHFTKGLEARSAAADKEWAAFSEKLVGFILPEWSRQMPGFIRKLQHELSDAPGSLAEDLWAEAHDVSMNPEIRYTAEVRVSDDLCPDEKEFLNRRKKKTRAALAKYLHMDENDIHPDDIPTIAMCGSGGGLRALIAGTGSFLAASEDGLFDCATYTAGVSGSCWLQLLYLTSFNKGSIPSLLEHLKARTSTHIAYPPVALQAFTSLPTSRPLLSGVIEKIRGDKNAHFGLVDIYGLLLGARFLVPKGELGVSDRDFKISSQRDILKDGDRPLPIYTAVRHEIPGLEEGKDKTKSSKSATTTKKELEKAEKESWFQWFEITPYEVFCEEIGAGIPTWALGRRFKDGKDVPLEHGFHLPETRTPLMMGIFGSAFCATLSHYYKEVQPVVKTLTGFSTIDQMISDQDNALAKVHPIDPAIIPNYAYQMYGKLAKTATPSMYENAHIQLMDAGMSNNLPIYPLLRPGRGVDVLISFDASADIKTDNWLAVADGYARQRGIKGWPLGVGWPQDGGDHTVNEIKAAEAHSAAQADAKIAQAKADQKQEARSGGGGDLGYCTVWIGTTEERTTTEEPPATQPVSESEHWRLTDPNAGLAVVYVPFLPNDKVPGVSPAESDFMSTWNFIYTPENIEDVVRLARANYDEGKAQIRNTVRAVYERKKQLRLKKEKELKERGK